MDDKLLIFGILLFTFMLSFIATELHLIRKTLFNFIKNNMERK